MSPDVFTIYWILKNEKIEQAEDIARQAEKLFNEYPHWKISEEQERELKKKLYKIIMQAIRNSSKQITDLGKNSNHIKRELMK